MGACFRRLYRPPSAPGGVSFRLVKGKAFLLRQRPPTSRERVAAGGVGGGVLAGAGARAAAIGRRGASRGGGGVWREGGSAPCRFLAAEAPPFAGVGVCEERAAGRCRGRGAPWPPRW